jgi:hypothetical protein
MHHIIVLGEAHLRRVLKSYADYYNNLRTLGNIKSHAILAGFTTPTPELKFSAHTGSVPCAMVRMPLVSLR